MASHRAGGRILIVAGTVAVLAAQAAVAHTPYLLPTSFAAAKDHVTLQAALTEDEYFVPDFAMRPGDYFMTGPSGARAKIEKAVSFKDMVVVEAPLAGDGTYRFSTGDRAARALKLAEIDGRWRIVRPAGVAARRSAQPGAGAATAGAGAAPAPNEAAGTDGTTGPVDEAAVPAGAPRAETQYILKSETYVTKGAPSKAALARTGEGFEVNALTHPNEIFLEQGFAFDVTVDGKPVEGLRVTVYRGGNNYEERKIFAETRTGANGRVDLTFDRPGAYLLTMSHPGRGADTIRPAPRSYVYSLTFEVLR